MMFFSSSFSFPSGLLWSLIGRAPRFFDSSELRAMMRCHVPKKDVVLLCHRNKIHMFWANYSNFSKGHPPKWLFSKGNTPKYPDDSALGMIICSVWSIASCLFSIFGLSGISQTTYQVQLHAWSFFWPWNSESESPPRICAGIPATKGDEFLRIPSITPPYVILSWKVIVVFDVVKLRDRSRWNPLRIKRTGIEINSLDMAGKRRSDLMALVVVPFVAISPHQDLLCLILMDLFWGKTKTLWKTRQGINV